MPMASARNRRGRAPQLLLSLLAIMRADAGAHPGRTTLLVDGGSTVSRWAGRMGRLDELAAAVRADAVQDVLRAVAAPGALVGADKHVGGRRVEVPVAALAIRPQLQHVTSIGRQWRIQQASVPMVTAVARPAPANVRFHNRQWLLPLVGARGSDVDLVDSLKGERGGPADGAADPVNGAVAVVDLG